MGVLGRSKRLFFADAWALAWSPIRAKYKGEVRSTPPPPNRLSISPWFMGETRLPRFIRARHASPLQKIGEDVICKGRSRTAPTIGFLGANIPNRWAGRPRPTAPPRAQALRRADKRPWHPANRFDQILKQYCPVWMGEAHSDRALEVFGRGLWGTLFP
jgi:hypothetical protein